MVRWPQRFWSCLKSGRCEDTVDHFLWQNSSFGLKGKLLIGFPASNIINVKFTFSLSTIRLCFYIKYLVYNTPLNAGQNHAFVRTGPTALSTLAVSA